jgi:hypothetical protein
MQLHAQDSLALRVLCLVALIRVEQLSNRATIMLFLTMKRVESE